MVRTAGCSAMFRILRHGPFAGTVLALPQVRCHGREVLQGGLLVVSEDQVNTVQYLGTLTHHRQRSSWEISLTKCINWAGKRPTFGDQMVEGGMKAFYGWS